ncbi:hypothetical protein WN943_019156 [Citrus x changshan-huyou]
MALVTVFELFSQMRQIFVFVLSDPIIDAILQLERLMDEFEVYCVKDSSGQVFKQEPRNMLKGSRTSWHVSFLPSPWITKWNRVSRGSFKD